MNLFGSNIISDGSHSTGTLLDQFPKKRNIQHYMKVFSGIALTAASSLSYGLGLGDIEPKSFLGQPLAANIELVSIDGEVDVESLLVRQVSAVEAEKMGVDIFYSGYRFDLKVDQSTGRPVVTVLSKESIDEPYLNILVELRWPSGVVYREYPLLLDPPPLVPVSSLQSKPAADTRALASKASKPKTEPARAPRPSAPSAKSSTLKSVKAGKGDAYKVQSGDTLWSIAKRWREGSDLSINDTMAWLHENNPEAFANGDMNRLKAGARLSMPDLSKLNLKDGLLPTPVRSLADTEESAPLEPVSAKANNKELEVVETKSVIKDADRPEQGLLVVSSELQDDRSRELIDMLERENEDLKERMQKIENSEYLSTLKQLVSLQRRQISELRSKLGERDTSSEEMSALLSEADVDLNSDVNTQNSVEIEEDIVAVEETLAEVEAEANLNAEAAQDLAQAKITEEAAAVELEPVLANPPEAKADRSLVTWLVFGAGAFLAMIFAFLLVYYRKMAPTKTRNDYEEDSFSAGSSFSNEHAYSGHFDNSSESDELSRIPVGRDADIAYDGEDVVDYLRKQEDDTDWLGEKVEDVEAFDAGAFDNAIQEVEDIFDSISVDDESSAKGDTVFEGMTNELPDELPEDLIAELSSSPATAEEEFLDTLSPVEPQSTERRSDNDVLSSIAAKMSQYKPTQSKKGADGLGFLEIDEESSEEGELDEVDATISRARMFCEFSQFDRARDLIEKSMVSSSDTRYSDALESIREEQVLSQESAGNTDEVSEIEGFTTSLDDEESDEAATQVESSYDDGLSLDDEEMVDRLVSDSAVEMESFDAELREDLTELLESDEPEFSVDDQSNLELDDVTEVLAEDAIETLHDQDDVASDLFDEALKVELPDGILSEGNLDLDLDIDIDFNDVDLEQDIQIEDFDDDTLDSKKKELASC